MAVEKEDKRKPVAFNLPQWLIDAMAKDARVVENRSRAVEQALVAYYGYQKPGSGW